MEKIIEYTSESEIFWDWTGKKINHNFTNAPLVYFYEREIWWAALGKNIGIEVDGKHENFERPVLILKVFSLDLCLILPCTTQEKNVPYLYYFYFNNKKMAVNFSQVRTISSKRLLRKVGRLDVELGKQIYSNFLAYIK